MLWLLLYVSLRKLVDGGYVHLPGAGLGKIHFLSFSTNFLTYCIFESLMAGLSIKIYTSLLTF